ncbi:MAG: glycerol-3-phosphate 1-O-acyltransferase PlsY [Christensenellales bacterium]
MVWMYILSAVIGYFIGCISFGYITGKLFKGKDIRDVGSGNAGTANVIRNYGWAIGLITFIGDVFKGAASALVGFALCGTVGVFIGGLAAVLGHIWPVFLKFRGGKGVATSLGVFLVMMPYQALAVFGLCVIVIALTKTMSIGSLIGTALMVVCSLVFYFGDIWNHVVSVLLLLLVLYSHRANIKRLAEGKENQL